jgi:hypothetical protein
MNSGGSAETARSACGIVNSIGVNKHMSYFNTSYGRFPLVRYELKSIGLRPLRDGVHLQDADYNNALYHRVGQAWKCRRLLRCGTLPAEQSGACSWSAA